MIIERSMDDRYLSNAYVVGDRPGGHAVLIDAGAPVEPLTSTVETHELTVTHLLLTHHHVDHVSHAAELKERFDCPVLAHPEEARHLEVVDDCLRDGCGVTSGELRIRALHTPGHTRGMLALVVNDECVFTGDTLFKGSVGGTMAPGHAGFDDLKRSVMEVLMALPRSTAVYPGHTDATTIGDEWESNAFVRAWRGLDEPRERPCRALGRPATLLLRAEDYDGGTKCWVRFEDGGDEIAPGSQVVDEAQR